MTGGQKIGLRQIRTLGDMRRADMLSHIVEGLPIILQSAEELIAEADRLNGGARPSFLSLTPQTPEDRRRGRAVAILQGHAEEEAAKALMLVDLVRCPSRRQQDRQRLASLVYDHLARMIYADSAKWRPANFAELRRYIDMERQQFYLDGPNDVDYVFMNGMMYQRESLLYADLVRWEDGLTWQPADGSPKTGRALDIARALYRTGALTRAGLEGIDEIWDPLDLHDKTHWQDVAALNQATLERLDRLGLIAADARDRDVGMILEWQFPLYPLDLSMIQTNVQTLTAARDRFSPY